MQCEWSLHEGEICFHHLKTFENASHAAQYIQENFAETPQTNYNDWTL